MNKDEVVNNLIHLTQEFYEKKEESINSLLSKSGYLELRNEITEIDIFETIVNAPNCIIYWLDWSQDKRVRSGWFFQKSKHGEYSIGFYQKSGIRSASTYRDMREACASFIKNEVEYILTNK
jgi:hypothetical protein